MLFLASIGILLINPYDTSKCLGFVCRYMVFFPMVYCYFVKKRQCGLDVLDKIADIVLIIAVFSLIFWIIGSNLGWIRPNFEMETNWGEYIREGVIGAKGYWGVYFETQHLDITMSRWRNCGIFCEAPAYAIFLAYALMYERFSMKERKVRKAILLVTILTTMSTLGYLYILIDWGEYIWLHRMNKIKKMNRLLPIMAIIGGVALGVLLKYKANQDSIFTRFRDVQNALISWKNSPLVGHGMGYEEVKEVGFTWSIGGILVSGGILFLICYLLPSVILIKRFFEAKNYSEWEITNIGFSIYFVFVLMFSNAYMCFFIIYILAFLYTNIGGRNDKNISYNNIL